MFSADRRKTFLTFPTGWPGLIIGAVSLLVLLLVTLLLLAPRGTFLKVEAFGWVDTTWFPRINAGLNGSSGILLLAGYIFIRRRQVKRHRLCMLSAFCLSTLFLVSYVIYHAVAGSTRFTGSNWIRPIYYAILFSHMIFATLVVPLVLGTLYRAWRRTFVSHQRIARWTLPLWIYVSASGVVVYFLLYHWN